MTTTADVARMFLADVGAPQTPELVRAVSIWITFENSNPTLRNNPLNLHSSGGLVGQIGSANVGAGDRNVAVFDTIEHGVAADAANLTRLPYYTAAVRELRSGDAPGFLSAIAASPWSAGHYRTDVGTGNKLLNAYQGTSNYGGAVGSSGGASGAWAPSEALIRAAASNLPPAGNSAPTRHPAATPAVLAMGGIVALALIL